MPAVTYSYKNISSGALGALSIGEQQSQAVFSAPTVNVAQLTSEIQATGKLASILIGDVRYKADADAYCISFSQALSSGHMTLLHNVLNAHTVA